MEGTVTNEGYHRYKQLDGLRGLAALTVFLGHYMGVRIHGAYAVINLTPLAVFFNGNAAVIFFFVLSGFVLSLPFVAHTRSLNLVEFYVRRIFRIFPAFMFAIVLSAFLKEFVFDRHGMAPFSAWFTNFWVWDWNAASMKEILKTLLLIGPGFNENFIDPIIWSLIIEMKIAIILPFFILIVSRGGATFNILFLLVVTRLTYDHQCCELPLFYLGILLAKYKAQLASMVQRWRVVYTLAAFLFAVFLYNNTLEFLQFYKLQQSPFKYVWSNYIIAIGSSIMMFIVLAKAQISKLFENRAFTFLGNISYGFYLVHFPLLLTMASLFSAKFSYSMFYIFLSTLASSFAISYFIFRFIEKPFQRFVGRLISKYRILGISVADL